MVFMLPFDDLFLFFFFSPFAMLLLIVFILETADFVVFQLLVILWMYFWFLIFSSLFFLFRISWFHFSYLNLQLHCFDGSLHLTGQIISLHCLISLRCLGIHICV